MPIVRAVRAILLRIERFFVYRVFSLDDTPHRIALGVAIGIFVTWTPTVGLQMLLTLALAWLLGANKIVGVPFVWISNPLTLVPIYGPSYWLGCKILGSDFEGFEKINDAIHFNGSWIGRIQCWFEATWSIFVELWVGSLVIAAVLGVITYVLMRYLVVFYRQRLHLWQEKHGHKHPKT